MLGNEHEVLLPAPTLEQILERLTHDALAPRAGYSFDAVQLTEIVLEE